MKIGDSNKIPSFNATFNELRRQRNRLRCKMRKEGYEVENAPHSAQLEKITKVALGNISKN